MNTSYIRRLALIVGISVGALVLGLNRGEYRLPPERLVDAYMAKQASRDDIALYMGILPGFGAMPGFMAGKAGLTPSSVFATSLWTGNASTRTITTGIANNLVWIKDRGFATPHCLFDTPRGAANSLHADSTGTGDVGVDSLTAFTSTGFTLGADTSLAYVNANTHNYAAWSFKKAAKFFDIQTWTGNSVDGRSIGHNLGVTPGLILAKRTDSTGSWIVWHRLGNGGSDGNAYFYLNATLAGTTDNGAAWGTSSSSSHSDPTSTAFTVSNTSVLNASGGTYVAYLFAHDPTGFIQCGSLTTDGSGNATVTLGWQPQFILWKFNSSGPYWNIQDATRSWRTLYPNVTDTESSVAGPLVASSTGFSCTGQPTSTQAIYMAIKA